MRLLGTIVKLQVQIESLKVGVAPQRRYDPAALRSVPILTMTPDGVQGMTEDRTVIPDVHNVTHPATKNRGGTNGVSICFTSHYDAMRKRFGDHLVDGIAGENILVGLTGTGLFTGDDVRNGIAIETGSGHTVRLDDVIIATPCVEFARYAMRFPDDARPDRTVTEAVQFLDGGMRGFYASYQGPEADIAVGDRIYLVIGI